MSTEQITRGVLAQRAGIGPETIRYYERIGLLEEPRRNRAGHRVYEPADLTRLVFIRRAQELGFSLEDIRELLSLRFKEVAECSHVERRATRRLVDVPQSDPRSGADGAKLEGADRLVPPEPLQGVLSGLRSPGKGGRLRRARALVARSRLGRNPPIEVEPAHEV